MNAIDVFADARPDVGELSAATRAQVAAEVFLEHGNAPGAEVHATEVGRDRRQVRRQVVAAAAAVLALVIGLALVLGARDVDMPAPADVLPPTRVPGEPIRLLPVDLSGLSATGFLSGPEIGPTEITSMVLARPQPGGGYTQKVVIQRGASDTIWMDTAGNTIDFEVEDVADGRRTWQLVFDIASDTYTAQAELAPGTTWQVIGEVSTGRGASRAAVVATALNLEPVGASGVALDPLTPGFEVVAEWGSDSRSRGLRYTSFRRDDGTMFITRVFADAPEDFAFRMMRHTIQPLVVRGHAGYSSVQTPTEGSELPATESVMWQEAVGQWVVVESPTGAPLSEVMAFAESLREVTTAEWDAVVAPLSEPSTPATTAPVDLVVGEAGELPGTVAPATSGRVLVANGTNIGGVASNIVAELGAIGLDVLDPANVLGASGEPLVTSRLFVRPGAEELGEWLSQRYGVDAEPIDGIDAFTFEGADVNDADVVLVAGLDAVAALSAAPYVVGDSLTVGASGVLLERGYVVNAEVSRQLVDVVPWIAGFVDSEAPNVLVVQLGSNGPFEADDFDALLDAVSDVPNVVIVNVHAARSWTEPNNALIADRDRPDDNVIVLDWDALAEQCPGDCFADDGIHLTQAGAEYFAALLGDISGY